MITSDDRLTAAFVAHQLNFAPRYNNKSLFVSAVIQGQNVIKWSDFNDKQVAVTTGHDEVQKLAKKNLMMIHFCLKHS